MKKKFAIVISFVLLLAICSSLFVGCDEIFKKNDKRDATQIVATVNYEGQTASVYKHELVAQFNNYAYVYNSYYGMTYQETADYLVKTLAQQKLLALYAKNKVAELMNFDTLPSDVTKLLTNSEYNHAIEEANDSLLDGLKNLVEDAINEDTYNQSTSSTAKEENVAEDAKTVYVRFDSNGGSDVEKQTLKVGQYVSEPTAPTKTNCTFYGWYTDSEHTEKFDFDETTVSKNMTLYAKWADYLAPRTQMEVVEEEDDYDPEADLAQADIAKKFFSFSDEELYEQIKDEDFVKDMAIDAGKTKEQTLNEYISDSLATLETNLKNNLYKDSKEECYQYYLDSQIDTILIAKLERLVGKDVTVSEAEVKSEFDRVVAKNKDTFADYEAGYESALKSSLSSTYYHLDTDKSYGFVVNILLKLDQESVDSLTQMYNNNPANKKAVEIERNRLLSNLEVSVSNPYYYNPNIKDFDYEVDYGKDGDGEDIEIVEPMTDPNNKYNNVAADGTLTKAPDAAYQQEGGNDYTQIISFEKVDGEYQIVYNATEAPTMPYLLNKVSAFGEDGIIYQIQNSLAQVDKAVEDGELTKAQGVYWLREVATEWLYLVGDDSGSVSSDSNNGGLGYLVTPEGKDSTFLEDFTTYARNLIDAGTGKHALADVTDATLYGGADANGTIAGDQKLFAVADSFIESGSTSNAYAGVFVLLASSKVWDNGFYQSYAEAGSSLDATEGILPTDYIVTVAQDDEDVKTIYEMIEDSLLAQKKADVYSLNVNQMGTQYSSNTAIFADVYKSLWEDLD